MIVTLIVLKKKIVFYHRYVDDTLVLFNGNNRYLRLLSNYLNSIYPNLKFTLEEEKHIKINFLDLTITKNENQFKLKIFWKPATTPRTIHFASHHPQNHKLATYSSFVQRLLLLPLSKYDYDNEVMILKQIAVANGYWSSLINQLITIQKKTKSKVLYS